MENITRLCNRIPNSSAATLKTCMLTKKECVTYSRNRQYAFKCNETDTSQERGELPLCIDTEDITMSPAVTDVTYSIVTGDTKTVRVDSLNMVSAAEIHSSIPVLTVISLTLLLWNLFYYVGFYGLIFIIIHKFKTHHYYMEH